jgi:hypothetical protein
MLLFKILFNFLNDFALLFLVYFHAAIFVLVLGSATASAVSLGHLFIFQVVELAMVWDVDDEAVIFG